VERLRGGGTGAERGDGEQEEEEENGGEGFGRVLADQHPASSRHETKKRLIAERKNNKKSLFGLAAQIAQWIGSKEKTWAQGAIPRMLVAHGQQIGWMLY
jgi:hypothetical protein